jgi:ribosome maturation factor RimP
MTARTPQRQHLMDLVGPVINSQGYDLEDLSVTAAGRRSLIRVTVDGDDGIDLDGIAAVSRAVSDVLDTDTADSAAFAGPYVLEVSSPGVDRPLSEPRHWRRAVGRLVTVAVGGADVSGRVVSYNEAEVVLDVGGSRTALPVTSLGIARVQVEFARPDGLEHLPADAADEPDAEAEAGAPAHADTEEA